jgi:hypothetical protein
MLPEVSMISMILGRPAAAGVDENISVSSAQDGMLAAIVTRTLAITVVNLDLVQFMTRPSVVAVRRIICR